MTIVKVTMRSAARAVGGKKAEYTVHIAAEADVKKLSPADRAGYISLCHVDETGGWEEADAIGVLLRMNRAETPKVHCVAGLHRSPTIAMLWLWWNTGETLQRVFDAVQNAYPDKRMSKLIVPSLEKLLSKHAPGATSGRSMRSKAPNIMRLTHDDVAASFQIR